MLLNALMALARNAFGIVESSPKNTVGAKIRTGRGMRVSFWQHIKGLSREYCAVLDMSGSDIESLESMGRCIVVTLLDGTKVFLIPKHTCGADYGDTWTYLLQARSNDHKVSGTGGGNTFITSVSPEIHQQVLASVVAGRVEIVKGRIWP